MNLRLIALFVTGVTSISASAETQDQKTPTLDELVTKNIEAKGGAEALRALQSLRSNGKLIVNEGQLQLEYAQQGRKDPEKMSADDAKPLIEDAEIDGPLVDWKAKESALEYLGREDVDGTSAYKIKVVRKNGDVSFVYLDPDHFLEIRILTQRIKHGAQEEVETDVGDYEKIGGVFVPFSVESGRKGDPDKQKIVIEKAEANVPVDDAIFHFPATASK